MQCGLSSYITYLTQLLVVYANHQHANVQLLRKRLHVDWLKTYSRQHCAVRRPNW